MSEVLVATEKGCLTFDHTGRRKVELAGRQVCAFANEPGGSCLAVVDGNEIWRRNGNAKWSQLLTIDESLVAITSVDGTIFAATSEPALLRISACGERNRLDAFDTIDGRAEWFAQGPPLHLRSLTATADGKALMAAVHVGGIPRSVDGGETWAPTIPVMHDVHEVRAHPSIADIVAAATAYGLCLSQDGGLQWTMLDEGLEVTHALAVAVLPDQVLFSVQSDPFADRSQIWRWRIGAETIEQVLDGLPQWLDGKVDSCQIAAGTDQAAVVDGSGTLWLSEQAASSWSRLATDVPYPFAVLVQ